MKKKYYIKTWPNLKTNFTAAQISYKKDRPADTISKNGYNNQAKVVEQVIQEIETRNQHGAAFAAELDIHKEIEALKQQLSLPPQQEANAAPAKTEM